MGRPPIHKSGAMTATQRQRRWRKKIRQRLKSEPKRLRRAERERELAARTIAASEALGEKVFAVLYVDPPWRHEPYSHETGMDRSADNHYPTMTFRQLTAMRVPAAKDCVLYLWFPRAQVANAVRLAEAWGFTVKTLGAWDKEVAGTGYWLLDNFEPYLIATKGHPPAPAPGTQPLALIRERRGKHSEKPDIFAENIATLYPTAPKLEMFYRALDDPEAERVRRAQREAARWFVHGNEA